MSGDVAAASSIPVRTWTFGSVFEPSVAPLLACGAAAARALRTIMPPAR
ncbi:MAG TPA: hypothetical protein VEJ41_07285 [Candidatus Acidoferrales bacterium]|nr:hypothetical protein [Candidatus Acidoferrales bacterium]